MFKMNTAKHIIRYWETIKPPILLAPEVEVLNPFSQVEVQTIVDRFYTKFFSDNQKRIFLIGINPGRLGSGATGIGFSDSTSLAAMGVKHELFIQKELSASYVFDLIQAYGGAESFFKSFYITALCPLGFVKHEKNINYYDMGDWKDQLMPYMVEEMEKQLAIGRRDVAVCIGKGENYKALKQLNSQHGWFERVEVIPHPRWVMQYRRKQKEVFINQAVDLFNRLS